jgi:hypothetical protein
VVVIGGGYIGMEVAAAACGWNLDTTVRSYLFFVQFDTLKLGLLPICQKVTSLIRAATCIDYIPRGPHYAKIIYTLAC